MAIQPGDFVLMMTPSSGNLFECVLGYEMSFDISFFNLSNTDPLYNLSVNLSVPDGFTFVSASMPEETNTFDENFKNIVDFINIKDLYPREAGFKLTVTIKADNNYRVDGSEVAFDTIIPGISVSARCDTKPRGSFNPENEVITGSATKSASVLRFKLYIEYPGEHLKGAGASGSSTSSATEPFPIEFQITNNTREESSIELRSILGNGIRYLGDWTSSGPDAPNFLNPEIEIPGVGLGSDNVNISLSNIDLSAGSTNKATFNAAIFEKLTLNGEENSGVTINQNDVLSSNAYISGNDVFYSEDFDMAALELELTKSADSSTTDVLENTEFSINYKLSEYSSASDFVITDVLPDGLQFVNNSSNVTPESVTVNPDGTTNIVWNLNSLVPSSDGLISFQSLTSETYIDGTNIAATDKFTNSASFSAVNNRNLSLSGSAQASLFIVFPTLEKEIIGYFDKDLNLKSVNSATTGDFVRFKITYDASNISAVQRNTKLYDYPPYEMLVTTPPSNVVFTGDLPDGLSFEAVPDNGILLDIGDLPGNSSFTVEFSLAVNNEVSDSFVDNLAKINIRNTLDFSTSIRDLLPVTFAIPNLQITSDVDEVECLSLGDTFTFNISLSNISASDFNADAFNLTLTSTLPSIYTINGPIVVSGTGVYGEATVTNNVLTLPVTTLPSDTNVFVSIPVEIDESPIMGMPYNIISSTTNGTSQQDPNSYKYTYNKYPLNTTLNMKGCVPTIEKTYIEKIAKLGDYYETIINVTIPQGITAYKSSINDYFFTPSDEFLTNVTLNDIPVSYTLEGTNIRVELPKVLDTSEEALSYTLSYDNRIMSTPEHGNYSNSYKASVVSTDSEDSNNYTSSSSSKFTIITPIIDLVKLQKNINNSDVFDVNPIIGESRDSIQYKLIVKNTGFAPAYSILVEDEFDSSLRFISANREGTFSNNTYSTVIPVLEVDESIDIIIDLVILDASEPIIATNAVIANYKANDNFEAYFDSSLSNITTLLSQNVTIDKQQKNLTLGGDFTKNQIKCTEGNLIKYKAIITNTSDFSLKNISTTDIFPSQFEFVSFDDFPIGRLSVENNLVTATIDSIPANSAIEYTYTVSLPDVDFSRSSSIASVSFSYSESSNSYNRYSNRVYIFTTGLGKGFKVY